MLLLEVCRGGRLAKEKLIQDFFCFNAGRNDFVFDVSDVFKGQIIYPPKGLQEVWRFFKRALLNLLQLFCPLLLQLFYGWPVFQILEYFCSYLWWLTAVISQFNNMQQAFPAVPMSSL